MIADEINRYLTQVAPAPICDPCISDAIYLTVQRSRTTIITNALATTREFRRGIGRCASCGRDRKKVTLAYRRERERLYAARQA
ncbi:MAG TPA: hypothetical protein PKE16_13010 [Hyphomicrobium sp.]|nr:hypothetical protein [Hyphomicrobium sp.]